MNDLAVWAQPVGIGIASLVAVWIAPRTFRTSLGWEQDGALAEKRAASPRYMVAVLVLWALVEGANALLSSWRYGLLPDFWPARILWLGLLGPCLIGGSWAGGRWLSVEASSTKRRLMNGGTAALAAFTWLALLAALGRTAGAGARINPMGMGPFGGGLLGGVLAFGVLLGAINLLAPMARSLRRLGEPLARALGGTAAIAALALGLLFNTASVMPGLRDLPGALPSQVESLPVWGVPTVRALATWTPLALSEHVPGIEEDDAESLINAAQLTIHAGIGAWRGRVLWSLGVRRPSDLHGMVPRTLRQELDEAGAPRTPEAWIRDWVR
jgi:hypothetical protein